MKIEEIELPGIRHLLKEGLSLREIAPIYGVTYEAIRYRLQPKRQVAELPIVKKWLAQPGLTVAGRLLIDFCIKHNLRPSGAARALGVCQGLLSRLITGKQTKVTAEVQALDFFQRRIAEMEAKQDEATSP